MAISISSTSTVASESVSPTLIMEDIVGYIPLPMGPINEQTTLGVQSKATKLVRKEISSPLVSQQGKCTSTRKRKGREETTPEPTPTTKDFETWNLFPPCVPPRHTKCTRSCNPEQWKDSADSSTNTRWSEGSKIYFTQGAKAILG